MKEQEGFLIRDKHNLQKSIGPGGGGGTKHLIKKLENK